ncbi:NADH-ubiquinone oxidoreductase subunit, mitochondrial precursor, partial [Reticulomyxa filosa]
NSNLLQPSTWPEALQFITQYIQSLSNPSTQIKAIAGDLCDVESMLALKDLFNSLGSNYTESRQDHINLCPDFRTNYLFNSKITGIDQSDICILIGCNPRMEAPLINARLRKAYLNGLDIYVIGNQIISNFETNILEQSPISSILKQSQKPLIIFGMSLFTDNNISKTCHYLLEQLLIKYPQFQNNSWNGISFLQTRSARNAALDIGFIKGPDVPDHDQNIQLVYLLGADEFDLEKDIPSNAFIIYQGSHGDKGASIADVVLPTTSFVEKNGTYVNLDGRVQRTKKAITAPGHARVDWECIRALAEFLHINLPYDNIEQLRQRLYQIAPHFEKLDSIQTPFLTKPLSLSSSSSSSELSKD